MKKSILVLIILIKTACVCFSQTANVSRDTVCLPIADARFAAKQIDSFRVAKTVITELKKNVIVLQQRVDEKETQVKSLSSEISAFGIKKSLYEQEISVRDEKQEASNKVVFGLQKKLRRTNTKLWICGSVGLAGLLYGIIHH